MKINTNNESERQRDTIQDPNDDKVKLKRKITLLNGIALIVGSIIGSGIFISPKGVFENSGESATISLIIWTACGLFSMLGAVCFSELGTTIIRSGGDYAYILEAFGTLPAYLNLWITLLMVRPTMQAISALTFANYILGPLYVGCEPPRLLIRLAAACCLCFLTYINCRSVRWAMNLQSMFTLAKLLALFIIIISGLVYAFQGNGDLAMKFQTVNASQLKAGNIAFAFYNGLFAYGGWNYVNFVTEELKNPYKNLPRAAIAGIMAVTAFYVLANFAYFSVLTSSDIMNSPAIATLFAQKLFARESFTTIATWFMPIAVAFSTFGGLNGTLFTTARLFYVGSQEQQVPRVMGMISLSYSTPIFSLVISCALSLIMLITSDVYVLISYFSVTLWLWTGVVTAALIQLRRKRPELHRPIKFSLVLPYTFTLGCFALTAVAIYADPKGSVLGLLFMFAGLPAYYIQRYLAQTTRGSSLTSFLQKLFLVTSTEDESSTTDL